MDERIAKWIKDVKAEGRNEGFADGKAVGYANGEAAGYANGEAAGYANGSVNVCRDFGKTQSETVEYLVQKLHLSREQAYEAVRAYW